MSKQPFTVRHWRSRTVRLPDWMWEIIETQDLPFQQLAMELICDRFNLQNPYSILEENKARSREEYEAIRSKHTHAKTHEETHSRPASPDAQDL